MKILSVIFVWIVYSNLSFSMNDIFDLNNSESNKCSILNFFDSESDVISYMSNKVFYNSSNGLEIKYGYISAFNTYGIIVKNKNGSQFNYINVEITPYGDSADLYGMSAEDGSNFGFRLYKGKLIVGKGESEEVVFYLK
jgi:hypothetical protein